jgi:non-specific protein-tyrosine kinase
MNDFIEIRRILTMLMSRRWLVVGVTLAGALLGLLVSRIQTPVYDATTTMLVGQFMQTTSVSRTDFQTSMDVAKTYADIAQREPVLDRVVSALELNQTWQTLKEQVHVKALEGTQLIEITAEARTPEMARAIADQVAAQLIVISPTTLDTNGTGSNGSISFLRAELDNLERKMADAREQSTTLENAIAASTSETLTAQLQEERTAIERLVLDWQRNYVSLSDLARVERQTNNYLTVIEPAQASADPVRPVTGLNAIVGGSLGFILVIGLVYFMESGRDTYRTADELYEPQQNLPVLGVVGKINSTQPADKIVANQKPFSPLTESYRMIRNKIQFRPGDQQPVHSILITSPTPGDGKSITAVNLAVIMAKAGHKTILVDADMSQPSLHTMFNVDKHDGLADLLDPHVRQIEPYIKDTYIRTLSLVTSGTPAPDGSERISTERMTEVMRALEQRAEIVIYDSPPALLAADAAIVAGRVDGVVMVLRAGKTRRSDAQRAIADLENVDAKMLGIILNGANVSQPVNDYRTPR